ncbi:unnamed protein product [Oncorhynchus mykiss]|uniref:Uncharacterized protein n=1 Tax=Oncorhynchus mykiss TaxID=8022 RepID=A0A060Z4U5_ONCMY|nr:unnamed protein product [Oncorhynchus mykiss]
MLSLFKSALVGLANTGRSTGLQGVLQSHRKVLSAGMKTYEVPPDYSGKHLLCHVPSAFNQLTWLPRMDEALC